MKISQPIAGVFLAALLSACGGGGGGGATTTNAEPQGYWSGPTSTG